MDLTTVAVANAIVWSGIILVLLLYLIKQGRDVEHQVTRLESELSDDTDDRPAAK